MKEERVFCDYCQRDCTKEAYIDQDQKNISGAFGIHSIRVIWYSKSPDYRQLCIPCLFKVILSCLNQKSVEELYEIESVQTLNNISEVV